MNKVKKIILIIQKYAKVAIDVIEVLEKHNILSNSSDTNDTTVNIGIHDSEVCDVSDN